jgi:diguanylate cyclase (GGDEF)-like protein
MKDGRVEEAYAAAWKLTKRDPQAARVRFQELKARAEEADSPFDAANALLGLGRLESFISEIAISDTLLEEAAAAFRALDRRDRLAWALNYLGCNRLSRGEYLEASEALMEALAFAESSGDALAVSTALNNLGEVYRESGNYLEAIGCFERQAAVSSESGSEEGLAYSSGNIGQCLNALGRHAEALPRLRRAIAWFERAGDTLALADALKNQGVALAGLKYRKEAEASFRRCIEVSEGNGERYYRSEAYVELGILLHGAGLHTEARSALERGLELATEIGADQFRLKALRALSTAAEGMGEWRDALSKARAAEVVRDALESQEIRRCLRIRDFERRIEEHRREAVALKERNSRLESLAVTDPLTGAGNRRALYARLADEARREGRYRTAAGFGLLFIDLDNFKYCNDTWGHAAGDLALAEFARALQALVRSVDFVARFGGDEFTVLMPETDRAGCESVARKVIDLLAAREGFSREILAAAGATGDIPRERRIACSIGVVHAGGPGPYEPGRLLELADAMLYEAKRAGKGRFAATSA